MIELNHVVHYYENSPMNFHVHISPGECVVLLGASGAGKSTLLNIIAGFQPIQEGDIILHQHNHTHSSPASRPISMLFQENNLFPHLTVKQNIALGLHTGLMLTLTQQQQINEIAKQVGLFEYLSRYPDQLSGGQRQRVALARCFIRNKPILLLDEPFSALDPLLRQEMLQLLKLACSQQNLTLLLVSHHLSEVISLTPRALVIANGTIVYDGNSHKLLKSSSLTITPSD